MTGRMLIKLLLLLMLSEVLLFSVSEAKPWFRRRRRRRDTPPPSPPPCDSSIPPGTTWYNNWHQAFNTHCPPGSSISQWKSIHRDCKNDRIHHFKCIYSLVSGCACGWSVRYENGFGERLSFKCPNNGVIAGVISQYSSTDKDRRFGFRCCVNGYGFKAHTCVTSPYKNVFDGDLDYTVELGSYLVGVTSYYDNHHKDRRWSFEYCKFSK